MNDNSELDLSPDKQVIGEISPIPSAYTTDAVFTDLGATVELTYTYEYMGGLYAGGIGFDTARAYRFRAESHCTSWHFEAYDTLVEVLDSSWVRELRDAEPSVTGGIWTMRHFLIYLDDSGAYEVVAKDVEWLPVRRVS
ncbi:hypothetical protein [Homoserinibacter sp. GY 40078]|uniref:hypothetical protein n=1 Tax=Homoserinibacter sp. GY 40078 TaxID=2603275 RepID=UPI0011CC4F3F|nr:hypothetical protein [Homoserinibacter sp. GY 40078]TXK17715.1 hypothetical protein FVQ89_13015 [Homoserinibacter sp. GY 40078]